MKSENTNRIGTFREGSPGGRTLTYDEKVKLFNAERYLAPMLPIGTKNWIMRDHIRYIDQHGRWYPTSSVPFKKVQANEM
jgi:hypothetical protein